jgi:hypothetical protein
MEAEISRGISDAEREQRIIDHRIARLIAEQLHGPDTPLHALALTGEVRPDTQDQDDAIQQDGVLGEVVGLVAVFPDKQAWLETMAQYVLARDDDPGPVRGWRRLTSDPEQEAQATGSPKIYVIDQLAGHSSGVWIEADQDPQDLQAAIDAFAEQSVAPETVAWEIFDYTGFGDLAVFRLIADRGLDATLEAISRVALGVAEHGQPFAAYVKTFGVGQEECDQFERRFLGRWPSLRAYAEHIADDLDWQSDLDALPKPVRDYAALNLEKLTTHVGEHVLVAGSPDGGVYLFGSA